MPESLPSPQIAVVDVPEVENFNGRFYYNFFTPDEKINGNGNAPLSILQRSGEKLDAKFVDTVDFNRSVPRYIEFTWKPVVLGDLVSLTNISIQKYYNKLHYEDDFTLNDYTFLSIQDSHTDRKTAFFVRKTIQNSQGFNPARQQSLQDQLKTANQNTDPDVTSELLELGLTTQTAGTTFFEPDGTEIKSQLAEDLKKVRSQISVNNKIISDLIHISAYDESSSPFSDELSDFVSKSEQIQETAQKTRDSTLLDSSRYDFEIEDYITAKSVDADKYDPIFQTIGYVIEKEEINPDRTITKHPPIFVETPNISSTVDVRIKYGAVYSYKIRAIGYCEFLTIEPTLGITAAVGFLIASKSSHAIMADCNEHTPPPSPADFSPRWDYKRNQLVLNWCFPVNTQRDVKKFQIFRRKSVFDPFQLIKLYNFDDSVIPTNDNEFPYQELVQKMSSPLTNFVDSEFTKNSKYIYSLCSIDAHGMSSGYSTQFEISFDKSRNKLIKKLISIGGAPKAYPNIFLNNETFVDSIQDEWHKKMRIYFNPDYLRVYDSHNNDLKLIRGKATDKYVLQLINIDLQKEQLINIQIQDLTLNQRLSVNNKKVFPINPDIIEPAPPADRQTDNNSRFGGSAKNSYKIG